VKLITVSRKLQKVLIVFSSRFECFIVLMGITVLRASDLWQIKPV